MTVILMSRPEIDRMNVLLDLAEERIRVSEEWRDGPWPSPVFRLGTVFRQRARTTQNPAEANGTVFMLRLGRKSSAKSRRSERTRTLMRLPHNAARRAKIAC